MPWAKVSDTAPMDPRLISVIEHDLADDRTVNELYGFYGRLVGMSGQHLTDYVVSYGTVMLVAGTKENAIRLLALAAWTGLATEVENDTGRRAFKLLDDPEFWHIKLADEVAWERQRQADNRNLDITMPVRCRDGDACRYCGRIVNFAARKGGLAGTYDHRPPGQPGSVETSVIACSSCNARRGRRPLAIADEELPLLPPPAQPYYSAKTRELLQAHTGVLARYGMTPPPERSSDEDLAPGRIAPGAQAAPTSGVRRATGARPAAAPKKARAVAAADNAPKTERPAAPITWPTSPADVPADPGRSEQISGLDDQGVPGRDGSGRVGLVVAGPDQRDVPAKPHPFPRPPEASHAQARRHNRRGSRGSRNRKPQQGDS